MIYIYLSESDGLENGQDKYVFKKDVLPRIKFKDYFEKVEENSFPEKWCILVTQDNYQELNTWMHRNWENYPKYQDRWEVTPPYNVNIHKYFVSCQIHSGHSIFHNQPDYTLITTEQFRAKYGDLKAKEDIKEIIEKANETSEIITNAVNAGRDFGSKKTRYMLQGGRYFGKMNCIFPLEIKRLKSANKSLINMVEKLTNNNEDLNDQVGIYYKQVLMLTEKLETIKKVLK